MAADVLAFNGEEAAPVAAAEVAAPAQAASVAAAPLQRQHNHTYLVRGEAETREPLSPMRKLFTKQWLTLNTLLLHVTLFDEVEVSAMGSP